MPQHQAEFDRTAVVTIQGGGVYGLGLLGQLSALIDRHEITPLALAGSSAGAIIATLYWAGLTPKEIHQCFIDLAVPEPDKNRKKGATLGDDQAKLILTDLLGPFNASTKSFDFARFRLLIEQIENFIDFGANSGVSVAKSRQSKNGKLAGCLISIFSFPFKLIKYLFLVLCRILRVGYGFFKAFRIISQLRPHYANRGFFKGTLLEEKLDEWIRSSPKLSKFEEIKNKTGPITFGDIKQLLPKYNDQDAYFAPLILTATNITTKKLLLIYSFADEFADVPIARAVRASAGFPLFFQPISMSCGLEEGWYVDGGVVSNFPAWVFSADLRKRMLNIKEYASLAQRPWLNIGLRSVEGPRPQPTNSDCPREFLKSFFGLLTNQVRNELERTLSERVPRSLTIEQPDSEASGPRTLLDVDKMTEDKIRVMFTRGDDFANEKLKKLSFLLPAGKQQKFITEELADLAARASVVLGLGAHGTPLFRSNIFIPNENKLVLRYAYNMHNAVDRNMEFDYNSGLTGRCYTTRDCWTCNLKTLRNLADREDVRQWFGMSKEQQLQVDAGRTWLVSAPIFDPYDNWPRQIKLQNIKPKEGSTYVAWQWESDIDGALLGVLNLDAGFLFENLNFAENMASGLTDRRTQAIIDLLRFSARKIALILADSFARQKA